MNKTTIVFIFLYLILFAFGGWWFYSKYFNSAVTLTEKVQIINFNKDKTIFYAMENNLYLLNSDNLNKTSSDISTFKLQSTGEVQSAVFDQSKEFMVYDSINSEKLSEIWKVTLSDNNSEKLFTNKTPGFEKYTSFRSPKMSKVDRSMAFIATSNEIDDIFIWDIEKNSVKNLTNQSVKTKISTIGWSFTESKIYYAAEINSGSFISLIDLSKNDELICTSTSIIKGIESLKDRLIISSIDSKKITNLSYILYTKKDTLTQITDIASPKTVAYFNISPNDQKIVYQVYNSDEKTNNLDIVNIDGTNLLQLTTDGKSQFGIFNPESNKIAYWVQGSGIYTQGLAKENVEKILNEDKTISKLVLWR